MNKQHQALVMFDKQPRQIVQEHNVQHILLITKPLILNYWM